MREADGWLDAIPKKEALALLADFGPAEFAKSFPNELSGGMHQKAALLHASDSGGAPGVAWCGVAEV